MIHSLPSSEPLTAQKLFSQLYVSYYARLVRFASLYVGAMGDAENIVQDFFLYLWARKEIPVSYTHLFRKMNGIR